MPANPVFHILRAIYIDHNDNDDNVGYVLEENPAVDPSLFKKVQGINERLVLPEDEGCILRYQSLKDSSHFLFSVIYPQKPNANHDRVHHVAVHFLMNDDAASNFFSYDFLSTATCAEQFSRSCLLQESGALEIPDDLRKYFTKPEAPAFRATPDFQSPKNYALLLQAANACFLENAQKRLFNIYYPEDNSVSVLAVLIGLLPPPLRHKLSFQSRFPSDKNDRNIVIRFPDAAAEMNPPAPFMLHLLRIPQEVELYDHIQYLISSWDEFLELGMLVEQGNTSLKKVLEKFPKKKIANYIKHPSCDFSESDKKHLRSARKKSSWIQIPLSRRRDQRRTRPAAAPAVQSQDQHHSESSAVPAVQPQDQPRTPPAAAPAVQTQGQHRTPPAVPPRSNAAPAVRTRPANRSRGSLPLLLLLLAVFVMSTALVLIGASRWWSVLSIFTGPAFGGYLVWNWKPHKR